MGPQFRQRMALRKLTPMARIYIETTIASFYYEVRTEPEMVARCNWTRRWLDAAKAGSDELVTSLAVDASDE